MIIIKDLGIEITKGGYRKRFVIAKCYCGNEIKVSKNSISSGNTRSCGCGYFKEKPLTSYKQYWLLQYMKTRCYNKNTEHYNLYGGRGIKIHQKWLDDPMSFIKWTILNGYKKGLYIDRINPNGNYKPANCRFVDAHFNSVNTRLLSNHNKSGYRGVSKHVKKNGDIMWRSRISLKGEKISLGVYNSKIEAAEAYNNYVINNCPYYPLNNLTIQ